MAAFRTGYVYVEHCYAGQLAKTEDGYRFTYAYITKRVD